MDIQSFSKNIFNVKLILVIFKPKKAETMRHFITIFKFIIALKLVTAFAQTFFENDYYDVVIDNSR